MKLKPIVFNGLNSTAIESISFVNNIVEIVWKGSPKSYKYAIVDNNFVKEVENTVKTDKSVGKLVNNALKEKKIELIQLESPKLNKTVV